MLLTLHLYLFQPGMQKVTFDATQEARKQIAGADGTPGDRGWRGWGGAGRGAGRWPRMSTASPGLWLHLLVQFSSAVALAGCSRREARAAP